MTRLYPALLLNILLSTKCELSNLMFSDAYLYFEHYWTISINLLWKKSGPVCTSKPSRKHCTVETIYCCFLTETRMLNQHIPVQEVFMIVIVSNCEFYPPIIHIVAHNMPMNSNRTHMISAFHHIRITMNIICYWRETGSVITKMKETRTRWGWAELKLA